MEMRSSLHFTSCPGFKRLVALTLCCSHQPLLEHRVCLLVSNFPFFNRQGASWSGKFTYSRSMFGWKWLTIPIFFCLFVCVYVVLLFYAMP